VTIIKGARDRDEACDDEREEEGDKTEGRAAEEVHAAGSTFGVAVVVVGERRKEVEFSRNVESKESHSREGQSTMTTGEGRTTLLVCTVDILFCLGSCEVVLKGIVLCMLDHCVIAGTGLTSKVFNDGNKQKGRHVAEGKTDDGVVEVVKGLAQRGKSGP